MRITRRTAAALALALLGTAPLARAQALIGGNGFQNGFAVNGLNNGFGVFNNGFGAFNNGFGGGFNNGFGAGNNGFAFGFGGPMNGGGMAMFSGPGVGFGGNFAAPPGFVGGPMMGGGFMVPPQGFAANNLFGVAAAIDQQVIRRPGGAGAMPAVRRRRR